MPFPYLSYFLSFPESDFFLRHMHSRMQMHPFLLVTKVSPFDTFNFSADGMCSFQALHGTSPSYH